MSIDDPFKEFSRFYDKGHGDTEDFSLFIKEIIKKYDVNSALDCSCGTGDDLIELHKYCPDIYGSDISDEMLEIARTKIEANNLDIPLEKIDFRNLPGHFERTFDMILCLRTSLPQLQSETDIKDALKSMKKVLSPKGVLVLSQGLSDKQFNSKNRFFPVINTKEHSRIMVVDYLDKHWEVHVLDSIRDDSPTDFKVYSFKYITLLEDNYRELLRDCGFNSVNIFGDFNFTEYSKQNSNNLIIVAEH